MGDFLFSHVNLDRCGGYEERAVTDKDYVSSPWRTPCTLGDLFPPQPLAATHGLCFYSFRLQDPFLGGQVIGILQTFAWVRLSSLPVMHLRPIYNVHISDVSLLILKFMYFIACAYCSLYSNSFVAWHMGVFCSLAIIKKCTLNNCI